MTAFNQEPVIDLLGELLANLPNNQEHIGGGINVSGFISDLARKWPAPLDPPDEKGLEALSRKVDISKKVWRAYDADWRKPSVHETLSPSFLTLLTAILIVYSMPNDNSPMDKGKGLKRVNTALNALDLCQDNSFIYEREKLAACANSLIEAILDQ